MFHESIGVVHALTIETSINLGFAFEENFIVIFALGLDEASPPVCADIAHRSVRSVEDRVHDRDIERGQGRHFWEQMFQQPEVSDFAVTVSAGCINPIPLTILHETGLMEQLGSRG